MPLSSRDEVRDFYDKSADSYNQMMDEEIKLPVYAEILAGLAQRISSVRGPIMDTSCGSGHMLELLRDKYGCGRALLGADLSPKMVAITRERLGESATVYEADMSRLGERVANGICAAVISFFSLHHVDPVELDECFLEWHRVLAPGGQLVVATWEGEGAIDYGEQSEILTRRYRVSEVVEAAEAAGFHVDSCVVRPVEDFDMDAVHLSATKSAPTTPLQDP